MARPKTEPTLDEWIKAHQRVVRLVAQAFQNPGSVKRQTLKRAVAEAQRVDFRAM